MSSRLLRLVSRAAAGLLALGAASAWAGHHNDAVATVYSAAVPTTSVLALPTAYTVPTTYALPTTYSLYTPTVYSSTSYLAPTVYVATSYVEPTYYLSSASYVAPTYYTSRRAARYRYVPSTYYVEATPTAYYLPTTTTLDVPLATTSGSLCCGSMVGSAPVVSSAPAASAAVPPPGKAGMGGGSLLQSSPRQADEGAGLNAGDVNGNPKAPTRPNGGAAAPPARPAANPADSPPPAAPAQPENNNDAGLPAQPDIVPPAAGAGAGAGAADDVPPRQVERFRPAFGNRDLNVKPMAAAPNLLTGRVVSGGGGKAEPGVQVIFSNQGGTFKDRKFESDAQGRFTVPALPDGDWLVQVEDAAGKAVPYATLTVSRGKVTDENGREWATLTLNR